MSVLATQAHKGPFVDAVCPSQRYLGHYIHHVGIVPEHVGPDRTRLKIEVVFVAQTKTTVAETLVRDSEIERLADPIGSKASAGAHVEVELEIARKRVESRENHGAALEVDLLSIRPGYRS